MTALLLRLAAPLQSWGTSSRFTRRSTDRTPSKSAVIGLLAAEGIRRTESIEHLLDLKFAVRTEQPGQVERDFQTAARRGERTPVSVSTRHYLSDAVFLAAVEGDAGLLEGPLARPDPERSGCPADATCRRPRGSSVPATKSTRQRWIRCGG